MLSQNYSLSLVTRAGQPQPEGLGAAEADGVSTVHSPVHPAPSSADAAPT